MKHVKPEAGKAATNGDTPVTQHDLSLLAGHMTARIDQLEANMATRQELAEVQERLGRVERTTESILTVVQSIDAQLKEWRTIPQQVARLNADVFELKMKVK